MGYSCTTRATPQLQKDYGLQFEVMNKEPVVSGWGERQVPVVQAEEGALVAVEVESEPVEGEPLA